MSHIYFISAVGADPDYPKKRKILGEIEDKTGKKFFFPLERHNILAFEVIKFDLLRAALVVADLSFERPSCYFELGIARCLSTRIEMIAAKDTFIHQTASSEGVSFYGDIHDYAALLTRVVST